MLVWEVLKSQGSSFCSAEKGKMICVHESFDRSTTLVMTESSGKRWKRIEKTSWVEKKFELENQYEIKIGMYVSTTRREKGHFGEVSLCIHQNQYDLR